MKSREFYEPTQAALADVLGIPLATMQSYVKRGLPGRKGKWPVVAAFRWILGQRKAVDGELLELKVRRERAAVRRQEAEADAKRHAVDLTRGRYVEKVWHESELAYVTRVFLSSLQRAGEEIAGKSREEIEAWVYRERVELARGAGDVAGGPTTAAA